MDDKGELANLRDAECLDFVYFQRLVAKSRSFWDDNINHRLNEIDTKKPESCRTLWNLLETTHSLRVSSIKRCIQVLMRERANDGLQTLNSSVLSREISLLQSELTIEDIVVARTIEYFKSRCRRV